ncbi:MAG: secretion system protein E [Bacillota bacterium]|nr:secretion system protein E [Bacillota bacterium]
MYTVTSDTAISPDGWLCAIICGAGCAAGCLAACYIDGPIPAVDAIAAGNIGARVATLNAHR